MERRYSNNFWSKWIVLSFISVTTQAVSPWKVSTACFGSDILCSQYSMTCDQDQHIIIGHLKYGTKSNRDCLFGVSNCNTSAARTCCFYDENDTLTDFSQSNRSSVKASCEGKQSCSGWAPRISSTPSSSYVWMQYACIHDGNAVGICSDSNKVGTQLFLEFNILQGFKIPNSLDRNNCSCKITSTNCDTRLNVTFVDMQIGQPQSEDSNITCSSTTVEAMTLNQTYQCAADGIYGMKKMTSFEVQSSNEIISLRNIYNVGTSDPLDKLLIYVEAIPESTLEVHCFPLGVEATSSDPCHTSTTNRPLTTIPSQAYSTSTTINSEITQSTLSLTSPTVPSSTLSILPSLSTASSSTPFPSTLPSSTPATTGTTATAKQSSSLSTPLMSSLSSATSSSPSHFTTSTISSSSSSHFTTSTISSSSPSHFTTSTISSSYTNVSYDNISLSTLSKTLPSTNSTNIQSTTTLRSVTSHIKKTSTALPLSNFTTKSTSPISSSTTSRESSYKTRTTAARTRELPATSSSSKEHTANVTGAQTGRSQPNTGTHLATVTVAEVPETTTKIVSGTGDDDNRGVIIGVTVAVVATMIIIVGVLVACLWIRIKRKEAVRRNYVRNTNIFYSFPQDHEDTGSTTSNTSPDVIRRSDLKKSDTLPCANGHALKPSQAFLNNPLRFENYKIRTDPVQNEPAFYSSIPYDNFARDTTSETIEYAVNGVDNDVSVIDASTDVTDNKTINGTKNVTFDQSATYAKVQKEGRTKF